MGGSVSKRVQVILLCEDDQQVNFAREYLKAKESPLLRIIKSPDGKGSGAKFVVDHYPDELDARRRDTVNRSLAVFIDEDSLGVAYRRKQLEDSCHERGVALRNADDRVGVFIPARNIETWLRYLENNPVDEETDYKPHHAKTRNCKLHIQRLAELCRDDSLPVTAPTQLRAACRECARVL